MDSGPTGRFRTARNMPSWVTESSDRVGPPPPPPPVIATDPEYEVIDVANQQYSNAPPPVPLKSPDIKRLTVMKCDLCGSVSPIVRCEQCDSNLFCASCDDRYHRHPKRQTHARKPIDPPPPTPPSTVKPPLPPKGEAGVGGPLPPPRKNKRPGSFHFPSPMMGRKQDQTIPTTVPQGQPDQQQQQQQQQKPPPPPPSPALSLREKMNSLKRFIHPSNRPLPDPPENKIHSSNSSLDTVSKRSPSVGMSRSVSTTMEKIQNNTAATLDRMTLLQQRYRQHQETMKSGDGDRSRRASLTSNTDLQSSATESSNSFRSRPTSATFQQPHPQHQFLQVSPHVGGPMHQQAHLQQRWLHPPAPRIRSGSVASGINLLPGAPTGLAPALNASNAPPASVSPTQRSEFGDSPPMMPNAPRSLSTSVFNLHQPPLQQPNMWGFNPLHQAQSMAHFNPMQWNQMNAWMARGSQNGSNMSLNLPSPSPHGFPQDPSGYPPAWANAWGGMYPYPMGMMPMMPGVAMPPPRSRANSRSRAASPALSVKSRKSTMSMRNLNRNSFVDDLTDDEDSEDEFRRSRGRGTDRRRRERLNSTSSIDFDEPEPPNQAFVRASSVKHSRFNRDRRGGGSSARSLIDYPVSRKPAAANRYEREEFGARERFDKMALASPSRKPPSDSYTNESDAEPEGTRRVAPSTPAGRTRSSNDGFSSPRKVTSDSLTNDSDADFERRRQAKLRAAQNNLSASARRPTSDSLTNDSEPDHDRRRLAGKANKQPGAVPAKKQSSDSDGRDRQRKISSDSKASGGGKAPAAAPVPKKIPSDSHTPDTDGEQKRRFATKQQRQRKHSSTEFIANDSDEQEEQTRGKGKAGKARTPPEKPPQQQVVNGLLEFRTISPAKSDSDEQRHLKTVEIKNIINEDTRPEVEDFGRSVLEDSPPPPAPVAPNCEWQCEFCTYVNEPGVKICAICCKTATIGVVSGAGSSNFDGTNTQSRSPPPDVVQEVPQVTEVKLQLVPPQKPTVNGKPTAPTEAKKKDDAGQSDVDDEEDDEMDTGMTVEGGVGKPGGGGGGNGVGNGFDQQGSTVMPPKAAGKEEQVEKKVVKEKVSTGCGPSPPREIVVEAKRNALPDGERSGMKASTGTSPPPQDMSTQTYDSFEQVREEIAALEQTVDKPINNRVEEKSLHQQHHNQDHGSSLYKRSYSLATPQLLQVDRPASRNSISSDTQSLPPSPHELSPQPGLQSSTRFQANTALNQPTHPNPSTSTTASSSSVHYGQQQDETLSYLDRAIHQIIQTAANQSRGASGGRPATVHDSKYRTVGDLRRIEEPQPSVAKVVPAAPVTVAQTQPKKTMLVNTMDDQIDPEEIVQQGQPGLLVQNGSGKEEPSEMTLLLREAERYQFSAEELQAALNHCGDKHPVQWLRGNWNKLIETVQTLATKYGHEKRENTIGTISTTEAREALRQHRGNIWRAITECIEQRQRKYREIAKQGNFTREDIVTSLTAHHGNLELAMVELSKTQLKPFLMRIWGPPNGADNDSGNLPLLQQALREDRSGINSDIQQFISAHVEKELLGEDGCSIKQTVLEEPSVIADGIDEKLQEPEEQTEPEIATLTSTQDADQREEVCEELTSNSCNTEILKDIEALIQQMERNQESMNAPVLRNIQQLLTQLVHTDPEPQSSRSPSVNSVRSQSDDGTSPTTPPTPTASKANAKASKTTKSDAKKKSTTTTTTTTPTTADPSGRKQSIVRKKSTGSPFGTVQTNTVKAMQKEFLSKAKDSPKPSTSKVTPKPSKLVQPKVFTNVRASPPSSSSKASTPASDGASSSRSTPVLTGAPDEPGPSTSSSYTCEKMLKKKYRETCFSDDYQTTDDEDESRMTITESERTIIKSLVKPYEPDSDPPEIQAKKILDDGLVQTLTQAELAVQLIELRYARDSAIWAATQCHTIDEAKDLLQKECELCLGVFPMNEIVSMLKCTHTCCLECAKEYFTQEITNRSITNCNCPYCKEPNLNGSDVTEDDVLEYFSNLDILLKSIVDEEVHDLFQRKIRDRTLTQDPNFKWCVHCSSGFFARPKQRRLTCPDCGSITCASCRKPWESQHEGLTCEKYAEWKEANDPELQAEGVQRHLQTHGISCPNCKFRYSLARGGCMHFTCTQCKFEFCYGCNKPFMMGAKCSVSPYCAKLGLHAHHPRNCLFYLRDKEPRDLQNLLLMNNVSFDTEPSEMMKQEHMNGQSTIPKCPIPLQKETPAGLMDMICSAEVPEKHAGLCRTHYVEYLVSTVSKAQIDPLPILDLTDCVQELRRRGIPLPERGPWDTDVIYREMCQKIVKEQIPLNN
ncbi:E3 ubiquitin-protein ligase lubel [Anopheles ziemanni]|uniref:E3 ubiquitin-protein ligase lubel n=1 Tax=Anopheles coustani TaxID=139045 RepID=UPI002657BDBA|nr:E3 ubiquitin-protein ligase lubel [Anopheles coustani]XP_058169686.1 E3 ubiquitin-protein ligase lubel [Anopheles ziemanni]